MLLLQNGRLRFFVADQKVKVQQYGKYKTEIVEIPKRSCDKYVLTEFEVVSNISFESTGT